MILGASIVFLVREQRRGGDDSNTEETTGAHGFAAAPACAREVISNKQHQQLAGNDTDGSAWAKR